MKILYCDADIVVCVKPFGVLSQISSDGNNMIDLLKDEFGEVFPVHRLDRTTGGVMVYARNSKSAAELSKQIADKTFQKTYIARIEGNITPSAGDMEDLLYFDRKANKSFVVKKERNGVKKAKLSYETTQTNGEYTTVKIKLYTGRTHQIRVQFASRGYPLVGDRRYGSKVNCGNINLWSQSVQLLHPTTKELLQFKEKPIF